MTHTYSHKCSWKSLSDPLRSKSMQNQSYSSKRHRISISAPSSAFLRVCASTSFSILLRSLHSISTKFWEILIRLEFLFLSFPNLITVCCIFFAFFDCMIRGNSRDNFDQFFMQFIRSFYILVVYSYMISEIWAVIVFVYFRSWNATDILLRNGDQACVMMLLIIYVKEKVNLKKIKHNIVNTVS